MTLRSRGFALALATVLAGTLTACGLSGGSDDALVVYNAQHESLTRQWADAFTAETGVEVELRNGSDFDLGNQLVAEGDASEADVYLTENSPAISMVAREGLLAPVADRTLEQVPEPVQGASTTTRSILPSSAARPSGSPGRSTWALRIPARFSRSKRARSFFVSRGQAATSRGSLSSASERRNLMLCERGK